MIAVFTKLCHHDVTSSGGYGVCEADNIHIYQLKVLIN